MAIKERIKEYCEARNIAVSRFEHNAGISNGYFNNIKKRPSPTVIEKIYRAFPDLNTVLGTYLINNPLNFSGLLFCKGTRRGTFTAQLYS